MIKFIVSAHLRVRTDLKKFRFQMDPKLEKLGITKRTRKVEVEEIKTSTTFSNRKKWMKEINRTRGGDIQTVIYKTIQKKLDELSEI